MKMKALAFTLVKQNSGAQWDNTLIIQREEFFNIEHYS
jgi:hypothetical protein